MRDNADMAREGDAGAGEKPGPVLAELVPPGGPSEWPKALIDTVVSWRFLINVAGHHRVRPWLILMQWPSSMGPVSFAVPRLVPESSWQDAMTYQAWLESTWGEGAVTLPLVLTVAEAAAQLPRGPTRPRWANPDRLVSVAVRSDLRGLSSTDIVEEDHEAELPTDRARAVRKEITSARAFLAKLGALPWAAFDNGQPHRGTAWWTDERFLTGLARWRADATNLSWRDAHERVLEPDPVREAAFVVLRAPWVGSDPLVLAQARGLLQTSARDFTGTCQTWLEGFLGWPGQTPECHADLVYRSDMNGSTAELRAIWAGAKAELLAGS